MTESTLPEASKQLEELVTSESPQAAIDYLESLPGAEATRAVLRLSSEGRDAFLSLLNPDQTADLLEMIPDAEAASLLQGIAPKDAAQILEELPSNEQADLLHGLGEERADAILSAMDPEDAFEARLLTSYADDVAGGLMMTEYLSYYRDNTVDDVVYDLRQKAEDYKEYDVQYVYVTKRDRTLVGVLRLRDLLLAGRARPIGEFMIKDPLAIDAEEELESVRDFFLKHNFFGAPVVDKEHRLLGVIQDGDVQEALADQYESDYLKAQGIVGGEELRSMPLWLRARRRLSWLTVNIVLNVIAASVIALYQDTLAAVIALAVFLPIISDMSGCSGNQAVAVSMRELSLGVVTPKETLRVWFQEIKVGLFNGIVLGLLLALVATAWKGSPWLGLVVGAAMALNTMIAVSLGGTIPLILRRFGKDPALASGPILTTFTDICGFLLVLSMATALMPRL